MKKMKKLPEKMSRKKLIKKLDRIVSETVKLRDECCVICGSKKQLGAGHVFSRNHYSTRWDLANVFCQCWSCNFRHRVKDPMPYYNWYIEKFGWKKMQKLYKRWKETKPIKTYDLEKLHKKLKSTNYKFKNPNGKKNN